MKEEFSYCIKQILRILFLSICFIYKTNAQNLVPNGDFETYTSCPSSINQIYLAFPWIDPTSAQAECFNECSPFTSGANVPFNTTGSYQYAKSGKGYAGINTYVKSFPIRIYIQNILNDTLVAGEIYCISFYVNCADAVNYAIDAIGAYVSKTAVTCGSGGCLLNYTPQVSNPTGNILTDTAKWIEISGSFIATGGEKYITIGNFNTDANTNTTKINNIVGRDESYYYIDDVSLMCCNCDTTNNTSSLTAPNIFTPNNDGTNDIFKITSKNIKTLNCKIYNRWGILVGEIKNANESWEGRTTAGLDCTDGVYYYVLSAVGIDEKKHEEKGFVQLIR